MAKYILQNLAFLRLHGELGIRLNNLKKSACDVCLHKELPGYKTKKLQAHQLH